LNRVDLPTFGSPTIPQENPMLRNFSPAQSGRMRLPDSSPAV
jgi:hypothetical protein